MIYAPNKRQTKKIYFRFNIMKFLIFILFPTMCAISMHHMSFNHEKISILQFRIHLRFGSRKISGNNAMQWNPNRFQNRIKEEKKKWFWFRKHIACGNCILAFLLNRSKLNTYECVDDEFSFK